MSTGAGRPDYVKNTHLAFFSLPLRKTGLVSLAYDISVVCPNHETSNDEFFFSYILWSLILCYIRMFEM